MKVVVLAAGKGVRMLPLTKDKPKILIEVARKPFLYHVLENIRKSGLTDVGIVVHNFKEQVEKFAEDYNGDLNITLIEQEEVSGTGNAVLAAREFAANEDFIVVMGDNLYSSEDIKKLADEEEKISYVAPHESDNPKNYGVLTWKEDFLKHIDEKPENPASNLVNTGLYRFTPEIFSELKKLEKSPRGEYELTDAINVLAKEGKVKVHVLKDYWIDMSSIEKLPQVEKEVLNVI